MKPLKVRGQKHRLINAKEVRCSHTLGWMKQNDDETKETRSTGRSTRQNKKTRKDYKQMDQGVRITEAESSLEPTKNMFEKQTEHKKNP